jgi:hypothetical protein
MPKLNKEKIKLLSGRVCYPEQTWARGPALLASVDQKKLKIKTEKCKCHVCGKDVRGHTTVFYLPRQMGNGGIVDIVKRAGLDPSALTIDDKPGTDFFCITCAKPYISALAHLYAVDAVDMYFWQKTIYPKQLAHVRTAWVLTAALGQDIAITGTDI